MRRRCKWLLPSIDIEDAKHGYFVHSSEAYPVVSAPDTVFRAAVLSLAPGWSQHADYGPLLNSADIDLYARWFILCELASVRPMKLYPSRESAEQECGVLAMRV